jgi:mono/diheme cytochrome c family protein
VNALRSVDRVLALVAWLAAAVVVVMLLAGPAVVASDKSSEVTASYGSTAGANGAQLFKANCGSCHTLSAAGTSGAVGPNLDNVSLPAADIEAKIRSGGGVMPSFSGQLSPKQIADVAAYVSSVAGKS